MRRIARLFLAALFVLIGLSAVAGTAVAAPEPATPFRYHDCYTFDGTEACFDGHGVYKTQTSSSGDSLFKASGTSTTTVTENGQLVYQASDKYNYVSVTNPAGVYHSNGQGEYTFLGTTCTYKYNITYANGEVRHEAYDFNCSP